MKSLADHIDAGAQVGDMFEILGFDPYASHHTFGPVTRPPEMKDGAVIEMLDWHDGAFIRRCRFQIGSSVYVGKAHALRVQCRKVGEQQYE